MVYALPANTPLEDHGLWIELADRSSSHNSKDRHVAVSCQSFVREQEDTTVVPLIRDAVLQWYIDTCKVGTRDRRVEKRRTIVFPLSHADVLQRARP